MKPTANNAEAAKTAAIKTAKTATIGPSASLST